MVIYFGIGVGALGLLFLIESQFFLQVTQLPVLGYGIAAIFEIARVGTSMIKQAIAIANRVTKVKVSVLVQGITLLFQVSLVVLSLICSMVVVTSYLEGAYLEAERPGISGSRLLDTQAQPLVASTLAMLREGLRLDVKPAMFISLLALFISALFQATGYIVFGHIMATQSREIEHLFEVKMQRMSAKKNFTPKT